MNFRASLTTIAASLALALPTTSLADHGHGGWHGGHGDWHGGHGHGDWHGGHYHGGYFPFFWPSFGFTYASDPYYYGGGPYYGRTYYYGRPVYRGAPVDSLGVDVQQALRRRGYYRGAIDGVIGPGSRAAIRAFQHDRGLAVTGRIDTSLVHSLGID